MAGSFGGSAFGGGNSTFGGASTVNPFYSTYGNPLQGGIGTGPNTAFGTPMYGNLNATSTNLLGGQGTAGSRGGSASGSGGMGAGSWPGPLYGALGIVPAARQQPVPPARVTPGPGSGGTASNPAALSPVMQADFQDLVNRSDGLSPATRNGVKFGIDGVTVVLRGAAANEVEARLLESLIHYAPGVREVRNEMTWRSP
jgi:hypothetical protein